MNEIIVDNREQYPLDLSFYGFNMIPGTVKTGDYSIPGLDLCIERKRNTGEIAMNLGSKWKQFKAELDRMIEFKYKFILCEFTMDEINSFPENSGIPKKHWKNLRMSSNFIQKRFFEETANREIEIIFAGNKEKAEEKMARLIRDIQQYGI